MTPRHTAPLLPALALVAIAASGCAHAGAVSHPELAFVSVPIVPVEEASANGPIEDDGEVTVEPKSTPAFRYAQMGKVACEAELTRRGVSFTRVPEARGVLAPIRLAGPVGGVTYRTGLSEKQRATSVNEVLDCRLVLALDDFSAILREHEIETVIHMSGWRPPRARSWAAGRLGTRHDGALALDAGWFVKRNGDKLDVEKDFHGRIGAKTCGPGTGPSPATPAALELRAIVCEAAERHLFQVALTPDYNWPHRNHFHLEVTPKVKWFLIH